MPNSYSALPDCGINLLDYDLRKVVLSSSYTYRYDDDNDRIGGYVDNDAALRQAIKLALSTEAGKYDVYPPNYGIVVEDLYGVNPELVMVRLPERIKQCLLQDLRIKSVEIENLERYKNQIRCVVICNGNIEVDYEIEVD